ncbi:MAG: transporter substrate-binding domain-containing protein [Deltaproteobacteria bacterium]|nr:transporter substrate-binding domain-containing protein [Deltaproteobacteria bacterium]
MKAVITLLVMAFLVVSPSLAAGQSAFEDLKAVAAIPRDFPPEYTIDKSGNHVGFALDVMDGLARQAGLQVTYHVMDTWPEAIEALRSGRADLIPTMGITPSRQEEFDFTTPVAALDTALFVRQSNDDIKGLAHLAGKKVAAIRYDPAVEILEKHQEIEVEVFSSANEALFELVSGGVDALVYPRLVLLSLARQARLEDRIKIVGQPLAEIKRAIAVKKGHKALLGLLDLAASNFLASSEYRRIYTKWYGQSLPFWTATKVFWAMSGVAFLVLLVMVSWRYVTLVRFNRRLRENIAGRTKAEESLKAERQRLFRLLDGLPAYVYLQAPDYTIRFANGFFRERFGDPEGQPCYQVIHGRQEPCQVCRTLEILNSGQEVNEWQWTDGQDRTYQTYDYLFTDVDGSPLVLEFGIDITDREKAEKAIRKNEERLQDALAEKEVLLREIHHRVKNNMQVVSSLIWLQSSKMKNPQLEEALQESHNRIRSMALIHENLYRSESLSEIDLQSFVHSLTSDLARALEATKGGVSFKIEARNIKLGIDQAVPCGLIINELVTNSLKYAFPDGQGGEIIIAVRHLSDQEMEMVVKDNGVGLPDGFDLSQADSLGLQLVTRLAENQLEGTWEFKGQSGAEFTIRWPLSAR